MSDDHRGREPDAELARLRQERDLFVRLLELGEGDDLPAFLDDALALVIELTGARKGYLELHDGGADEPRWWIAAGCSAEEIEGIRDAISHGIIAQSIATGQTLTTASALRDPRFAGQQSVQLNRIEAVLCAPIGGEHPVGVVYLQGRDGEGPFAEVDRQLAERFARHAAPLIDRLRLRAETAERDDPTQPWRDQLDVERLVGRSPAMAELLRTIGLVAPLDIGVLITGPTGTGKTEVARAIHLNSPRAGGPLVELNCAAIPEGLVESELFGALPGAATGVTRKLDGKVAAADGGTLFLDEIGELPLASQSKLLKLLHDRAYHRLGSTAEERADIRVIAATNADLGEAVRERTFREDLYFRLAVLPIRLPALAERPEDVAPLAEHLLERAVRRHRLPRVRLTPAALVSLGAAEWPGNVRELANALERAAVLAAGDASPTVEPRHLFPGALGAGAAEGGDRAGRGAEAGAQAAVAAGLGFQDATRRFQRELVAATLDATGWNVSETARRLGLARSYLYELIHAFGLERAE